jgi:hypothetical protein
LSSKHATASGDLHFVVSDPAGDFRPDLVQIILEQNPFDQAVTGSGQAINEHLPRSVGVPGAGITDRQHSNIEGYKGGVSLGIHRVIQLYEIQAGVISQHPFLPLESSVECPL